MRFIENTKSAKSAMERIPREHKQPIKRSEFNKVLYKTEYMILNNIDLWITLLICGFRTKFLLILVKFRL